MSEPMEEYTSLLERSGKAELRFKALVGVITEYADRLVENYEEAKRPPLNWPSPDQISGLYLEWCEAIADTRAAFHKLPAAQQKIINRPPK